MASIRLNSEHRHYLRGLMTSTVTCPNEEKADAKAYERMSAIVRKIVEDRFPPKDMLILKKYDAAVASISARLQLSAGGVVQFCYRDVTLEKIGAYGGRVARPLDDLMEVGIPLVPSCKFNGVMYQCDDRQTAIWHDHEKTSDVAQKALSQKRRDYDALITASSTLEQIEEVWPEASALRKRIEKTLPVVLSDEVMARIRADAKVRKATGNVEVSGNFDRRAPRRVVERVVEHEEEFVSNYQPDDED